MTQTELTFLHILRTALSSNKVGADTLPADTDWSHILRLAGQHKLLPLLVSALPLDAIPNGTQLKRMALGQAAFQTQRTSAFLSLYEDLRQAGFHPLVVKGILCRGLYPQPDLRPSSDEDLYIPHTEFGDCCRFFREQGFVPSGEEDADAFEIGWRKDTLYIELHRSLFSPESDACRDLNRFFTPAGMAYTTEYGREVLSLNPHDHMLYLLLHAYKHFLHSGFGIRQVCDICLWADKYAHRIDWAVLSRQCGDCHGKRFAAAVLGIGVHFLQIPLDLPDGWTMTEEDCLPMLRDILSGGIYGSADSARLHASTVTLHAVEANRTGNRPGILRTLFPRRASMESKFSYLKQYPALLPLAWGQRIFRYLGKKNSPGESLNIGRERVALLKYYDII